MSERGFRPRALGEIAIRTTDMAAMVRFYEEVLGLEKLALRDGGRIVFFKIADGFMGHTAVLALFRDDSDRAAGNMATPRYSLHHLALSLPRAEQEAAIAWFGANGVPWRVEVFPWIGWRGVFVHDPDGNTVELVAYDATLLAS